MKIATWNVNGIRARQAQVHEWIERQRPDVVCLQEIKATSDQVPAALCEMQGYWCYWHGGKGYSGVALKACKGHTEALLMGAAAQKYKMFLCVQDLSCPGYSFLHSSSLAARIPTIVAIEGNSRQYCPSGNVAWNERFPTMFTISDGTVGTSVLTGPGLGF